MVVEASAGMVIAAAMSDKMANLPPEVQHVGLVICGGNADLTNLPFEL